MDVYQEELFRRWHEKEHAKLLKVKQDTCDHGAPAKMNQDRSIMCLMCEKVL